MPIVRTHRGEVNNEGRLTPPTRRSTHAYIEPLTRAPCYLRIAPPYLAPLALRSGARVLTRTIRLRRAQLFFIALDRSTYVTHDEIPICLRIPALQRDEHSLMNPQRLARTFGVLPVKMSYDVGAIAQHDQYFGKPAVARRLHENRMELRTNVEHANQVMLRERDAELAIYATQLVDFLGGDIGRGEDGGM